MNEGGRGVEVPKALFFICKLPFTIENRPVLMSIAQGGIFRLYWKLHFRKARVIIWYRFTRTAAPPALLWEAAGMVQFMIYPIILWGAIEMAKYIIALVL